jgi:DNA-binding NarL/FixJ family response regulator
MPELDGLAATRDLLSAGPEGRHVPKILILTTFDVDDYVQVYEALAAGASGFLLKDTPPQELVAAVRAVAAGESLLASTVTRRLIEHFVSSRATREQPPDGMDELIPRELDVFKLVARGLSNTEIAGELVVSEATVKTHVARILQARPARPCPSGRGDVRVGARAPPHRGLIAPALLAANPPHGRPGSTASTTSTSLIRRR